jgi:hypothetical protein
MKNLADLLGDQKQRFNDGRDSLARLQALFDTAFGAQNCLVKLSQKSLVVSVRSAGLASEVQMQKHTLIKEIRAVVPEVNSVRISIGLPLERNG